MSSVNLDEIVGEPTNADETLSEQTDPFNKMNIPDQVRYYNL